MSTISRVVVSLAMLVLLVGCAAEQESETAAAADEDTQLQAVAEIGPANDSAVQGRATFAAAEDSVTLLIEVEGAQPGLHAVHIHELGDCSAADATSAGGHWNPMQAAHGRWDHDPHHLGDIGNLMVADDGSGTLQMTSRLWSIGTGELNDVVGKAIIMHVSSDDFSTQPTGGAGSRIACGVIQ